MSSSRRRIGERLTDAEYEALSGINGILEILKHPPGEAGILQVLPPANVTVSTSAVTTMVAPDDSIQTIIITNQDAANSIIYGVGSSAISATSGHLVGPNASVFFSRALGDTPQLGIFGLALVGNVTVTVTTSKLLLPKQPTETTRLF